KGHFQVVQTVVLQAQQQARADAGYAPQVEFGGGFADGLFEADTGLLGEGGVDLQQHSICLTRNDQQIRALLNHRGVLLFRLAQRVLGLLGFADVDHRSEEHTSELQSRENLVCRLLLEKKKKK